MQSDSVEFTGTQHLRIAFVIGTLGQGGAEKQCLYMIRSLLQSGMEVDAYCIGRNEVHEASLQRLGVKPRWIGRFDAVPARLATLTSQLWQRRPHIVQAAHTYVNLYAAAAAASVGAISIGAVRSNLPGCLRAYGRWTPALMRMPSAVVANSRAAVEQLSSAARLRPRRTFLVPNAIDLAHLDHELKADRGTLGEAPGWFADNTFTVISVARLIEVKRIDRLIRAVASLKARGEKVRAVVVGDGPERQALEQLAAHLGLTGADIWFAGASSRVAAHLATADALVFCSDDLEGFPNTIMEAMAASLPVVATRAGDAAELVKDGVSGKLVPFDDGESIAAALLALSQSSSLRAGMARAARARIEGAFDLRALQRNLFGVYEALSFELGKRHVQRSLRQTVPQGTDA